MASTVEIGIVGKHRRALGAALEDLYEGVGVCPVPTGSECMDVITINVQQGPTKPDQHCVCRARYYVSPYLDICSGERLETANDILDRLTGCGEGSIAGRLGQVQANGGWAGLRLVWEDEAVGVVESVDPAVLYGLTRFNPSSADDPNNAVSAQMVVTVRFNCCKGGGE